MIINLRFKILKSPIHRLPEHEQSVYTFHHGNTIEKIDSSVVINVPHATPAQRSDVHAIESHRTLLRNSRAAGKQEKNANNCV